MKARFVERTQLTSAIASFSFEPERNFNYTAGQYIELSLTGHEEHGHVARRWFTLSGSPHQKLITITTRIGNGAHSAFKRALNNLEFNASVEISEPMGDFVLPKLIQVPLVFVAGGIGITPFNSMLEWLDFTQEERPIKLLYSVKTEDDIIFQDTFVATKQHATIVVTEPSATWGGVRGSLNGEMIVGLEEPASDALFYLSGPEPFVQHMQAELERVGISHQQIVVDEFQGYDGI